EYKFSNSMNKLMAVSLKAIDTTGVTVSYAYSDTKLSSVTETSTPFEAPTIASKSAKYIYIVVSATSSIPTTFTSSIVWYQGEAGELSINVQGTSETQTVVKGTPVEVSNLSAEVPDGYEFGGWYLDEDCTIPAPSTFNAQGQEIYVKLTKPYPTANLPSDWLAYDSTNKCYYITTGTSTLPIELVIPETYNDGTNGMADVTYIEETAPDFPEPDTTTTPLASQSILSITLPKTITQIPMYTFCEPMLDNSHLTNVDLTYCANLNSINAFAFYGCSGLTSIDLSQCSSLTSIENNAFYYCSSLTSLTIPSSVTSIGDYAFYYCSCLTSLDLSKCTSLTSIGGHAFSSCSGLTSVTLPSSLTSIGTYAFGSCSGLTSITIPSSVTSIGEAAFNSCSGLTSIVVEDGNSVYDSRNNCNAIIETNTNTLIVGLTTTKIPNDIEVIGTTAFAKQNLINLDLSNCTKLTTIKQSAFASCKVLTKIILPSSLTSIETSAFGSCYALVEIYNLSSLTITLGNSSSSTNGYLGQYAKIIHTDVSVASRIQIIDNLQYYVYGSDFIAVATTGSNQTTITLDTNTTEINEYAFSGCSSLTSISLPSSLTSIGTHAFSNCSGLTSIDLSKCTSLTTIGTWAFSNCSTLTSLDLSKCTSLTTIRVRAFNNCKGLTSITIPANVTKIGQYAFNGCSSLTSITFKDTSTWYRVSSETNWNNMTGGTSTSVTTASTAATYFKSTYASYYWYKK
ncbi:MAG: leucine-rich repeat domain-containing protein, partial [Clostridia bacterium]|nr:leucine-rich repeat domain-containing protein [Clostridia bacterium]